MKTTKKLKTITLSLGLAALMFQAVTVDAQVINRGLLQNPYKQDNSQKNTHGLVNRDQQYESTLNGGLGNAQQEDPTTAPLGGGIAVLVAAGAGYALLKRKEETK